MSLRKRKGSPYWWYDFTVGGARFRGSTETADLSQAKAIEAKLRTDALMGGRFGRRPEIALDPLLGRYWLEYARHLKAGPSAVKYHCRHILDHFGKTMLLSEIDDASVSRLVARLRGRMTDSSINRVLSTLRKIINKSRDEWGYQAPDVRIRRHMLPEPEARTRWLTQAEAQRLIDCAAEHLKNPIRCALLTGLRLSNILHLRWDQIDFDEGQIDLRIKSRTPGGRLLVLPISPPLRELLLSCEGDHAEFVFVRRFKRDDLETRPIESFRRSFGTACRKAGISDFTFHDLRHTAATWMVQNGVALDLVQEVLGHTDIATTKRYAHRSLHEKHGALARLAAAQIRHTPVRPALKHWAKPLISMAGATGFEPATYGFGEREVSDDSSDESDT